MKKYYLILAIVTVSLNLRPIITSVAPMLGIIQEELGMSGLMASLMTTLPVLCMGLFSPVATKLSDRIGLERAIFMAILIITIATAIRGIVSSEVILVVTALMSGIGISIAGPLISSFIKKYFPTKPALVSLYSASMTVGAAFASAFTLSIYTYTNHSMKTALSSWSIFGIIALVVWSLFIFKGRKQVSISNTKLPLRNKRAILITLLFGLMSSMFYSVTAWISPIAVSMGYSQNESALLLTLFTLIQIPASLIVAAIVVKYNKRRTVLITLSFFEIIGLFLLLLQIYTVPAVLLIGIGAGGLFPIVLMLPIVETNSPQEAGAWSAMNQGGGYIIASMGPLLVGTMQDYFGGFEAPLIAMIAIASIMVVVQWFITDHNQEYVASSIRS